jgi:membrane protein YqaA with SNARE-associated domain
VLNGNLTSRAITSRPYEEGLAGFANEGLLTVAVLFVVAAGISATGGLDWYMGKLLGKAYTRPLFRSTYALLRDNCQWFHGRVGNSPRGFRGGDQHDLRTELS